jgi:NAD(P)-dependent dehydrogenase (short-subunit alcohol dehydrogenase family)
VEAHLSGRIAIVTGAARNIGAAVARRLAEDGAFVVLADIEPAVHEVAERLGADRAVAHSVDVGAKEDVDRLFDDTLARFGTVDVLVNNAAVVLGAVRHFLELDEELWNRVIGVNLTGTYLCSARAARCMAEQRRGVIVNVSSGGATRAHRGMVAYDASKGAIEAFTRALALDLAPYGIRAVGVVPGLIQQEGQSAESIERTARTVPLGRIGLPEDVAPAVSFLVSDDAAYITGSLIVVDGAVLVQQRSPQVESFPLERFPEIEPVESSK